MATKENKYEIEQYEQRAKQYLANREAEPIVIGDVLKKMGLSGPRIPATELRGQTFTILRASPFVSSFDPSRNAWFCVIQLTGDDNLYTTVLGGGAVVDVLEAIANAEIEQPIQVTLEWVEGGRYSGYYQFA